MERKTPRLSRRFESLAKKPSTALSQEQDVGTEVEGPARVAVEPPADLRVFVRGVVVEDRVDVLAIRDRGLDGVEEADELLMAMPGHVAADDGPLRKFSAAGLVPWRL